MAVKSENEKPLGSTVNLYVASNNIQPLKLGVSHFGSVDNKDGIYKIYEAYIPKSQNETYVVELTPCQGKAEMFISKDIRRFNNKQYDSDSTKLTNGRLYAVLKSESESISKYIIVVKSLNNATNEYKSLETTQFKIEARRYPTLLAKKTYVEKYFVPNEGEIDWKVSDDGKYFDISWPRIYNIEGSNELPTAYTNYDIYINKEDRSGLESPCSITQLFTPINEISVDQNSYKIKIDDYVETEDIYINVIGHVTQDDTQDLSSYIDYPIAYRPLKIHMDNVSYDDGSDFLFWLITITIILALLILLLFLYRKYRRVKHKLATEVREVNQIEYGTELKPTKVYNRFPDENSQQDAKV